MFPNFRKIFREFRPADEERQLGNEALFKFCGFAVLVGAIVAAKRLLGAGHGAV